MGFLQNLTDDQTAILGCSIALFAAFMVMSLSARLGTAARGDRLPVGPTASATRLQTPVREERRRAA